MRKQSGHRIKTTCSYCGVGCGIEVEKDSRGKLHLQGDPGHPANKGMLCSKGMNLQYTVSDTSDRILHPEMRWNRREPRRRIGWGEAMKRAAAVFKTLTSKYGPDSVGFYVSGQCLTEEYYVVNKLVKGFIGTNNIDTNSRLCMSSAVTAYKLALGEDAVPVSYDDIELADLFFIAGANPAWCHPILFRRIEQHRKQNPDVKIMVADPRKTQTCAEADLHLQLNPGTDTILYHAIARCLIEEGQIESRFIENHTDGYAELKQKVMEMTVDEASARCGVPPDDIRRAAGYIGYARGFISMWAMGLNQSVAGVNKNLALINLSLLTGHIGKPGSGPFSLTGQPNAMGGREVGGMANLLPAHRDLANPSHRQEVADCWGVPSIPEKPGLTATEMFEALRDGRMKAIWIICTNPVVSLPDSKAAEEALKRARFVVVQDISHRSESTEFADLLLPAAGWLEKEGTMTNSDRRISYLGKGVDPPGEALPDAEIICRFGREMGFDGFEFNNSSEIFNEHVRLTKGTHVDIGGLDYRHLKENGTAQWPFPANGAKGTKRLFTDHRFYTPSRKAQLHAVTAGNHSEQTSEAFPQILTTGRIRDQWHTRTRTGKVNKLLQHLDTPFLEIHPDTARLQDIRDNEPVMISSRRGRARATARITNDIKPGVVFLPMHWGKVLGRDYGRANNLTNNLVDPRSKEPDFKYSAVRVAPFRKQREKIIVAGAGAAACRFITSYRGKNREDEIHVFSKEKHPFYNRVQLPDYISGAKKWKQLEKFGSGELEEFDIHVHAGVAIERISRDSNTVTDSEGVTHSFDRLILATGSRANRPANLPALTGIFTIRYRSDADRLKKYLHNREHAVIVGGGLLGLELAGSLREIDKEITVIQRSPRLMDRQLDNRAGELLRAHLEDKNIRLIFNDEVEMLSGSSYRNRIRCRLKSGKLLEPDAVVYAVGTRPNIELADQAGLQCKQGVTVNEFLQTSRPEIFAIGEIAEFNRKRNGITAAAEEQAEIAAGFISGDLTRHYTGSLPMNILKFSDLQLCSLGQIEKPANDPAYEEVVFLDEAQRYYKKCIIHNDRLVGAILMGDKSEFAEFRNLIERKLELSAKRMQLLRSGKPVEPMLGKLVCSCNNVGDGNIIKAIDRGNHKLDELCQTTGAGTGCGSCRPEVKIILERHNGTEVRQNQAVKSKAAGNVTL